MLKVMIVDDEPYVREGLKYIIDWEENGFEICGDAKDGDEAYSKIQTMKPNIVLMDIQMSGKLGIDVIKEITEQEIDTKFIVITGYSDFEYAKRSIKYGVEEYLLKPIDEEELLNIVLKIKKNIENKNKKVDRDEKTEITLRQHVLIQYMLNKEVIDYPEIKEELQSSRIHIALISNSLNKYNLENINKIEDIIQENIEDKEKVDIIKFGEKIVLVIRDININYSYRLLNNIKKNLDNKIGGNNFIALGDEVNNLNEIYISYKSAIDLINDKFLFNKSEVISNFKIENENIDLTIDEKDIIEKIFTYTEISQKEKIKENINELEKVLRAKRYREDEAKILITRALLEFKDKIKKEYKIKEEEIKIDNILIDKIYRKETLNDIINLLLEKLLNISNNISIASNNSSIKRIVKYVEKNYYKDLKLENLADIFNYNSAYLGKIFKSYTGESFNTYLDKVRIEEAKKLLIEENLKVYEVCDNIGYKNIDYFHSKFKKYVGISPLNYKKQREITKK